MDQQVATIGQLLFWFFKVGGDACMAMKSSIPQPAYLRVIVVLFLATVVDLSIVICSDCVITKGNTLETCHDACLPSTYRNLAYPILATSSLRSTSCTWLVVISA